MDGGDGRTAPLFETRAAKGRRAYKLFASTVFLSACALLAYRLKQVVRPGQDEGGGRWIRIGMLLAELWFGLYWIVTQSVRWNIVYRRPFKDRLSRRYEDKLPRVDVFVCTADPVLEPPTMVISTVLSAMSYNYPAGRLSLYLSDDGGSELTFYALWEASLFSRRWIPFCKKFKVEPRSPAAYFSRASIPPDMEFAGEWSATKKLYEEMVTRIEAAIDRGGLLDDMKDRHKGFSEWSSGVTKQDHQPIVQILIDGRNPNEVDAEGQRLPTVVYLARGKRPNCPHHFKAGSVNSLIRVSSEISNAPVILNLDCDMYPNDADGIRDALCFFMDEERGHEISYVQHPQYHDNISKNDLYGSINTVTNRMELCGVDGYEGTLYIGTGCFHRRESLCGQKFSEDFRSNWNVQSEKAVEKTVAELEETSKMLAACDYEKGTLWGTEMGLIYGCPVEDVVTGLAIVCRGWKPVYYDPERSAFLGVAPITLDVSLLQFKRWSEGLFQIFLSKYCPFLFGRGKMKLGAQIGYCVYLLWASLSFPTLYYVTVPSLCLLRGIPLFPKVSSPWFLPFVYVFVARNAYSLAEALMCGSTTKAWVNLQRMLLIRRTTAFAFAFIDAVTRQLGFSQVSFVVTAKVVDEDVSTRYRNEIMEFGSSSVSYIILSALAILNLFCLGWEVLAVVLGHEPLVIQMVISGAVVMLLLPVYEALFFRHDNGSIPSSVMLKSAAMASFACLIAFW